jgi:RecA-family ATPase
MTDWKQVARDAWDAPSWREAALEYSGNLHRPEFTMADPEPRLAFASITKWATQDPPEREWAVPGRFPLRNVSLLSGEGATGKSIILMQLFVAAGAGKDWLASLPEPGPSIYLNAEDEEAELHRRALAAAAHYGVPLSELDGRLHVLPLAGQDAVLGYPNRSGLIRPTPLFARLKQAAFDIKPRLIGLDTVADVFSGNEIDRAQVRQFIGLLRQLAMAANAGVILCAHPSLTGISSGTGLSGSTAWHNSVRARAYLTSAKTTDNQDTGLRQLSFLKNQYGTLAETITLRWKAGLFVPDAGVGTFERAAAEAKADALFLNLLGRFDRQGRNVSDKVGPSFAPNEFADEPEAKAAGIKKDELARAMRRLFAANRIRIETYGRPSRQCRRIVAGSGA